jgi:hypothetical protein
MAGTYDRLVTLDNSLSDFKATDGVAKETAAVYTALLEAVKAEHADDPVIAVIEPPGVNTIGLPNINAGTMRTVIAQLLDAYA